MHIRICVHTIYGVVFMPLNFHEFRMYVHMYVHMYMYLHVCTHVHVPTCMYIGSANISSK